MKQVKLWPSILICLFALNFAACDDCGNGDTTAQFKECDLFGGWKCESSESVCLYSFSENGSDGIIIKNADSENYERSEIIYTLNKCVTELTIIEESGSNEKYTIHFLDNMKLILEDECGCACVFKRYDGKVDEEYPLVETPKYEAVDLGLSVKWAIHNVGATSPEGFGGYFSWGEIVQKTTYIRDSCVTYYKKLDDISGNRLYDVATAHWGDGWRMPSKAEMQEIIDSCVWERTMMNNVIGYKVTGLNGNYIFLPGAGYIFSSSHCLEENDCCYYWSSSPDEDDAACYLHIWHGEIYVDKRYRYYGQSIRPVKD